MIEIRTGDESLGEGKFYQKGETLCDNRSGRHPVDNGNDRTAESLKEEARYVRNDVKLRTIVT